MENSVAILNNFKLHEEPSNSIDDLLEDFKYIKSNKKISYLNVAIAFDIESTSFYDADGEKAACMYAFTLNINGKHIEGRTWEEFIHYVNRIHEAYVTTLENRVIIWVHNLSFEFQWIRCRFKWHKVFALSEREVCYALTEDGIEFRCSYILSGYKLAKLGEQCVNYPIQKMVGDLDYSLPRHSETPLTPKEWKYIYHDGLVVVSYIQQCIEREGNNITNIPLTKTGYVRRYCRNMCMYDGSHKNNTSKYLKYRAIIKSLTISSVEEYKQLKRAYIGAHTHANPLVVGEIMKDVYSMDFTSSYPAVMLYSNNFPMSKGTRIKINSKEEFYDYINNYCCIFDVTFYNIESTTPFEHMIPASKCFVKENALVDNGKIVKASKLSMSLNEVDFKTFSKFYKWDSMGIKNFRRYMKGYLPKNLILAILHLYKNKTELKGIAEKFIEYMAAKGDLNSVYGASVTDICRDEITYNENNEWGHEEPEYEKLIKKYNLSKNRFLYYIWGLYVTSLAKANLASGILELGYDYYYSDTDSVKFGNYSNHKKYFDTYNKNVRKQLLDMCKFYKLNPALIEPCNIKGEKQLIGIWDYEGKINPDGSLIPTYRKFKTLGSKRYMVCDDSGVYSFTVSGCNKKTAIPYLCNGLATNLKTKKENFEPMDKFDDEMYIPAEYTGKNVHTYIDYENEGYLTDYLGNTAYYHEYSAVHLEPVEFTLSLSANFADYVMGLRGVL